ncbi:MAG: DUF805 domain-containing protein [Novosphingobium sp.]
MSKYVVFSGRASRSEYWFFYLATFLASIVASIIDNILGLGFLSMIVALGLFLPSIAAGIRRLHDTDRSGWWLLIVLIPLVGAILLIVWLATKGTPGTNQFGPDPLGGDLSQTFG